MENEDKQTKTEERLLKKEEMITILGVVYEVRYVNRNTGEVRLKALGIDVEKPEAKNEQLPEVS